MTDATTHTTTDWVINRLASSIRPMSLGALSKAYRCHHQTTHAQANQAVANAVDLLLQSREITWTSGPGGHAMYQPSHNRMDETQANTSNAPGLHQVGLNEVDQAIALVEKSHDQLTTLLTQLQDARRLIIEAS